MYEYALQKRDEKREATHEPYCLEQEIDSYAWPISKNGAPVKEVPIKVNDYAMDALRYLSQYLAESKKGGGILIATIDEEKVNVRNTSAQIENPQTVSDWRSLFYGDSDMGW